MNRRGFTLVELMAAIMIFMVIASASYALLETGRGVATHGEYEARRFQAARAAIRAFEADVKGVFSTTTSFTSGFIGKTAGTTERPADTLEIIAFNNQPKLVTPAATTNTVPAPKECDISRVAWSIDEDTSTEQAGLVRRRTKLLTEVITVKDPQEGLEEIAADIIALRIRYWDGGTWQEQWDSTTSGTLPKAIEVTFHVRGIWREKEEIQAFMHKIFLPVAAATPKKAP